jgi:hypothetical protein
MWKRLPHALSKAAEPVAKPIRAEEFPLRQMHAPFRGWYLPKADSVSQSRDYATSQAFL